MTSMKNQFHRMPASSAMARVDQVQRRDLPILPK
jgi:hypothetical protein